MANGPPLAAVVLQHIFGAGAKVDAKVYDGNLRFLRYLQRCDVSERISAEIRSRLESYLNQDRLEQDDLTEVGRLFTFLSYEDSRSHTEGLSRLGIEWAAVNEVVLDEQPTSHHSSVRRQIWDEGLELLAAEIFALSPDHIAFTTLFHHQFQAVAALSERLRRRGFVGRIVVGGAATKVARDTLLLGLLSESGIDLVYNRNVHAVPRSLLRYLYGEIDASLVESAVSINDQGALVRTTAGEGGQTHLVGPMDYELPATDQYFTDRTFPVLVSEGCYWGRCDFCDYPYLASQDPFLVHAKFRSPAHVVSDIRTIGQKLRATRIDLISDAIPLGYFRRLEEEGASGFRKEGISLECSIRAERHATAKHFDAMASSGIDSVTIGVEALSDEVLSLMRKGNTFADIERCVDLAYSAGIKVKANLIVDHPHIGVEHVPEMLLRLEVLLPKLSAIGVHSFSLSPYAPIAFNLARAGLALIGDGEAVRTDHGGHTLNFRRINEPPGYREAIDKYRSTVEAASFQLDLRGGRVPDAAITVRLPYRWCGTFAISEPANSDLVLSIPGDRAPFRFLLAERENERAN